VELVGVCSRLADIERCVHLEVVKAVLSKAVDPSPRAG
jgi:hypothetical protein